VLVLLLGVWIAQRLKDSRFGRALRAIAGSEAAANALGIDVARYKLAAFVVAAVYASVAGSLFAHFIGFISPEVFGLSMVTLSFTMLYLGGIGTIWGPIVGAVIVSMLPELFRGLKELQDIAYAAVLILILIFFQGRGAARHVVAPRTGDGRRVHDAALGRKRHQALRRAARQRRRSPSRCGTERVRVIGPNGAARPRCSTPSRASTPSAGHRVRGRRHLPGCRSAGSRRAGWCAPISWCNCSEPDRRRERQVGFHLVTRGAIGAALLRPRWMRDGEARIRDEAHDACPAFVGLPQADAGRHPALRPARLLSRAPRRQPALCCSTSGRRTQHRDAWARWPPSCARSASGEA
jgi:hypothetical protein